jgi:hypothetical protein
MLKIKSKQLNIFQNVKKKIKGRRRGKTVSVRPDSNRCPASNRSGLHDWSITYHLLLFFIYIKKKPNRVVNHNIVCVCI